MKCYVINLEGDAGRMTRMRSALEPYEFLSVQSINAVRGSCLPDLACELLTGEAESQNRKGTLGCSLSHAAAWEASARGADTEWALILEDDSEPLDLGLVRDFQLPHDVDLVFCNSRMVYQEAGTGLLPILPALEFIARNGTGVGTDGYLLSTTGAKKLLSYFARDGFYSHVDLRLAAYSLTLGEANAPPQTGYLLRDIRALRQIYNARHVLNSRVLGVALTRHTKGAPSSRDSEDSRCPQI
jgi:GR25 family glycosyltransferase involved in LPS biosynthesis